VWRARLSAADSAGRRNTLSLAKKKPVEVAA
jgi:hypothetical protein